SGADRAGVRRGGGNRHHIWLLSSPARVTAGPDRGATHRVMRRSILTTEDTKPEPEPQPEPEPEPEPELEREYRPGGDAGRVSFCLPCSDSVSSVSAVSSVFSVVPILG